MEIAVYEKRRSLQLAEDTTNFEYLYFNVRNKEHRVYSDQQVLLLPDTDDSNFHSNEWQIRKHSAKRLISYLKKKQKPLKIMDVGCGNGWLSAAVASVDKSLVIGFDVHLAEIEQAKRVFAHKKNLHFVSGSLNTAMLLDLKFDVIVFSASLQYFPSLEKTVNNALSLMAPEGEIHIIDTHFYRSEQLEAATLRTRKYFLSLGFPEMTDHYFHHKMSHLQAFNHNILFNPGSFLNKVSKQKHPFYWIKITH